MDGKFTGEKFDVKKIAKLANLRLSPAEETKYAIQFAQILTYIENLRSLKIDDKTEPTSQVTGLENIIREDEPTPSLTQDEALSGANSKRNGLFKVKAILDK